MKRPDPKGSTTASVLDLYKEEVLDHYQHPRNQGELTDPDVVAKDANASCGDMFEFQLRLKGEKGREVIKTVKWKGIGCAISTASASKFSEWLTGKPVTAVAASSEEELARHLGFTVNPGRKKCLMLPITIVHTELGRADRS